MVEESHQREGSQYLGRCLKVPGAALLGARGAGPLTASLLRVSRLCLTCTGTPPGARRPSALATSLC